jgi:hypothetical protein
VYILEVIDNDPKTTKEQMIELLTATITRLEEAHPK